jgi:hypothetical protein
MVGAVRVRAAAVRARAAAARARAVVARARAAAARVKGKDQQLEVARARARVGVAMVKGKDQQLEVAVVVAMVGKGGAVAVEADWVGFLVRASKADKVCTSSHSHYSRCLHRKAAFHCYAHRRTHRRSP